MNFHTRALVTDVSWIRTKVFSSVLDDDQVDSVSSQKQEAQPLKE